MRLERAFGELIGGLVRTDVVDGRAAQTGDEQACDLGHAENVADNRYNVSDSPLRSVECCKTDLSLRRGDQIFAGKLAFKAKARFGPWHPSPLRSAWGQTRYTQISDIRNSGNKKLTPDFGSSAEKNKGRDKGERISGCGCSREPTVAKKSITNPPC